LNFLEFSFTLSIGKLLSGDIFISIERVKENSKKFNQTADNEINRVIIHGVLHYMGYQDKTKKDKELMRIEEDKCLSLLES
jgi:rRNA maturation RNase YbeY